MKKNVQSIIIMFSILLCFGCNNLNNPQEKQEDFIFNPQFISFVTSERSAYAVQMNPAELYYAYYAPTLTSFKNDQSLTLGSTFERNIIGQNVSFTTTRENNVIRYEGNSDDNNIYIRMLYNQESKELKYRQIFIIKLTYENENISNEEIFMYTEFDTVIDGNKIHTPVTYGVAKYTEDETKNQCLCFTGKSEFYSDESLCGYFTKTIKSGNNKEYTSFSIDKSDDIIAYIIKNSETQILAGLSAVGYMYLSDKKIINYPEPKDASLPCDVVENVIKNCPWTLLED